MNLVAESPKHLAETVRKKKAVAILVGNHLTDINPYGGRGKRLKLIVSLQTQGESIKGPFVIN